MRIVESETETPTNPDFAATSSNVRISLHADLKDCGKSRDQVAFELTAAIGRPVSVEMIWVKVTGSRRLLDLLCEAIGLSVATAEDREFAELGRTSLRAETLRQKLWARC